MDIKARFRKLIEPRAWPYQLVENISDDKTLLDLGLDSLQIVELMLACEDEFGIATNDDADLELFSGRVGPIIEAITKRATR
jgi:acyl carrier protein